MRCLFVPTFGDFMPESPVGNDIEIKNRSRMNVPFKLANDDLTKIFVEKAEQAGLYALKGHRLVGGLRASLYNAMPFDGVECLVEFMKDFKKNNT